MINLTNWLPGLVNLFTFYKGGGGGGGGPSTVTQTTTQQLPSYAQPYAEQLMSRGSQLSNKEYTPYTGQRIAGLGSDTLNGIAKTESLAKYGFQGQNDAMNEYQKTVRGDYLNPASNPYLAKTAEAIGQAFNNTTNSQNLGLQRTAGAFGNSGLMQKMSGDNATLANSLNQLYGNNYTQERGNQLNAMQLAPNMQNMGYADAKQLLGTGDILRSYQQDLLNQQYGDWMAAQNQPYANLDVLQKALSGSIGNAATTMQTAPNPYQANPFASMIGGGLAGAGLGQALGFSPAVSGGLGAAGGLLFG